MYATTALLVFQLILIYHALLLSYTLASSYRPNLAKITHNCLIYKLISRALSSSQDHILLSLTLLITLALCSSILGSTTPILITLFIVNLFTALHSRIIRPLYFKITLYLFSPALTILYLISTPLLIIFRKILSAKRNDNQKKSTLKDFFSSSLNELKEHVSANDKSLIESICLFDTLEARQIMIPKVDMFCLDQETSVYTAAKACINMGFSRIPVFDGKVDNIHSVLLFKDLLKASLNLTIEEQKKELIKSYTSPIIFSPETKKIKDLFQEIKKQRIHASIIINEYGCTEGLVTMEDILEELLGSEILDESDIDEQILFIPIKDNSWIVNPKMSIIDARKHLDIDFKDSSEYETITGYIFSKMGAIPKPGAYIQEDSFHINILNSDQRKISKVKITKIKS